MDANYFLGCRLDLVEHFYRQAAVPFQATMEAITGGKPPFDSPPYSEDGEPPYEVEYYRERDCLRLLGATSLSSLAGSLQVFLDTLLTLHGDQAQFLKTSSEGGWWGRHQRYYSGCGLDFAQSGANLDLLNDVVLARNSVMHQTYLANESASYRDDDLNKLTRPFFVSESEETLLNGLGDDGTPYLFSPTIEVNAQKLGIAIAEIRRLGRWLEDSIWEKKLSKMEI